MIRAADLTGPTHILNVCYTGRFSLDGALHQLRHCLISGDASGFEMDLTLMRETIGELPQTWSERVAEILRDAADA